MKAIHKFSGTTKVASTASNSPEQVRVGIFINGANVSIRSHQRYLGKQLAPQIIDERQEEANLDDIVDDHSVLAGQESIATTETQPNLLLGLKGSEVTNAPSNASVIDSPSNGGEAILDCFSIHLCPRSTSSNVS
jgi:hypothetical protein